MQLFQLTYIGKERMTLHMRRARHARQTALLLRFCPVGKCLGVYQSPKAVAAGSSNWAVTQGEIESRDLHSAMRFAAHPAEAAAMRELYEELGVVQGMQDFSYLGSVIGCASRSHWSGTADYHVVGCIANTRAVIPNKEEVASFRWEDVVGCLAALQTGSFMSTQKTSIVGTGLRQVAHNQNHFGAVLHKVPWRDEALRLAEQGTRAYA